MGKPENEKRQPREPQMEQKGRGMRPYRAGGMIDRGDGWPLGRLRGEFERVFEDFFRGWGSPAWSQQLESRWDFDVEDQPDKIVVRAEAPGFEPDDFDLQVRDNQLVLRATESEAKEQDGGRHWHQQELYRSVPLPYGVDAEHVEAQYRNGILTVTLPKTDEGKSRRIEVRA